MTPRFTGRCACGQVTLAISSEPVGTRQCWCRQCQQLSGGGPTHNAIFETDEVRIEGDLACSGWIAASGNTLTSWFCASCGTPVYAQSSARPQFKTVRIGVLDEGHGIRPQIAIWTDDAPDWAVIDPEMEQFPQQPPAPPTIT
jgi:hypothetical protein